MSIPFSAVVTPSGLVFTGEDGKMHSVIPSHVNYRAVCDAIKRIQINQSVGNLHAVATLRSTLLDLADAATAITKAGQGRVVVEQGVVRFDGEVVRGPLTERILWGLREGFDMSAHIAFLENVQANPSHRSVEQLYGFIERHKMGLTADGHILGYKRVRADFKDIHSGTLDNSPGQIVEMPRNKVNDDPNQTCSNGLHFCSQSYLPNYGTGPGNQIVIVKVHPRDVVAVPTDYQAAKVRCCRYEVLGVYTGTDDLLASKPVFTDREFTGSEVDEDQAGDDAAARYEAGFRHGQSDARAGLPCDTPPHGEQDQHYRDGYEDGYEEIAVLDEDEDEAADNVAEDDLTYSSGRDVGFGVGRSDAEAGRPNVPRLPAFDDTAWERGYDEGYTEGYRTGAMIPPATIGKAPQSAVEPPATEPGPTTPETTPSPVSEAPMQYAQPSGAYVLNMTMGAPIPPRRRR